MIPASLLLGYALQEGSGQKDIDAALAQLEATSKAVVAMRDFAKDVLQAEA